MVRSNQGVKTTTMRLVEHLFEERLESLLRLWYEEGMSPPQIAARIREKGVPVTPECVRLWMKRLNGKRTLIFPGEACGGAD